MLQQTQVSTVIPYYERFMSCFPDVDRLASSHLDDVLALWSGLGYYSRARNMHKTARLIVSCHAGKFPEHPASLAELPGIGRSTAAAIAAFAFSHRAAILDGNVKRVFARVFGIEGYPGDKRVEAHMWEEAEALLPEQEIGRYTQALMDLGASLCSSRSPDCSSCPVKACCVAHSSHRVHELPQARPKKTLPVKETTFLVLLREGRVCFERRPQTGIWSELLCFPEIGPEEAASFDPAISRSLPGFTHTFTHFKLKIGIVVIETEAYREGIWMTIDEGLASSIPNPVRKILGAL
jgi:A/G-specific adenine glycosylase